MTMTLSDQVREAISNCGLTRYAISKQSGVNEGSLSRFMTGETDMTLRLLGKIAPLIGVTLKVKRSNHKKKGK